MAKTDENCGKCHHGDNGIGAPSLILPPKSVICIPCHAATFSAGDRVTVAALSLFGIGLLLTLSAWVAGPSPGKKETPSGMTMTSMGTGVFRIGRILILDVLLNRRLYTQSPIRWLIHSMIFLPFVFRFTWGLTGLIGSHVAPDWAATWQLLDRNHPATALLFDVSGLVVILGVALALIRKATNRRPIGGLPGQDLPALLLLGAVLIVGFILEGIRMAMAPLPPGAALAFVGYAVSAAMTGIAALDVVYGYVWYAHAVLTGMFLAYLPFSRMMHVVLAPITILINGWRDERAIAR